MIDLSSEPSLGSLILTTGGALKYSYVLPRGMTFPDGSEAYVVFTDRAGGSYELGEYKFATLSDNLTQFTWAIGPELTNQIPAGSNFEVFTVVDGTTYKVRYGRVVRKEVTYPLNPLEVINPPLMYEDDLQRNMPGPRWLAKYGAVSMRLATGVSATTYAMASRNAVEIFGAGLNLWSSAAVMWYAPLQSDSIEMAVKLVDVGDGECTIVFASNSTMTDFLGVRVLDPGGSGSDTIQVVKGTAWNALTVIGNPVSYNTPTGGGTYKITFTGTASTPYVNVYTPASATTPALSTSLASTAFRRGAGYRYTGVIFNGSLQTTGPMLYGWKVKDAV
jgi:hypothetical protein